MGDSNSLFWNLIGIGDGALGVFGNRNNVVGAACGPANQGLRPRPLVHGKKFREVLIGDIGNGGYGPGMQKGRDDELRMKYVEGVAPRLRGHGERDPRIRANMRKLTNLELPTAERPERASTCASGIQEKLIFYVNAEEGLDQLAIVGLIATISAPDAVNVNSDSHVVVMVAPTSIRSIKRSIRRRADETPFPR